MSEKDENPPTPISPEIARLTQYLRARACPTDAEYLTRAGIEYVGAEKIAEIIGVSIPRALGIAFHYPGTEYATVRLVPGGPRCPRGITPHAYLAREVDWPKISGTLVLCESPLKALTWCRFGYNAMSAGGTTTLYMPRKDQWCVGFPHAAIESGAITTVLVAWDSDTEGLNHNVGRDLRTLCRALKSRHPTTEILIQVLPAPPEDFGEEKWGCDDALAYHGEEWFREWAQGAEHRRAPERDLLQEHMDELSDQYVFCRFPVGVIEKETGNVYTPNDFKNVIEVSRQVPTDARPIRVAPIWISADSRPEVTGLNYVPGGAKIVGEEYNLWRPSDRVPQRGDVTPWLDLIQDAVKDAEIRRLMIQCMAYQLQHRGERLQKLIYFVGREVGTGKSTQANIMREIIGNHNTGWITRTELEAAYNADWAAKELIVLDDVQKLKADTWPKLKSHITSDRVTITQKYMPARQQQNYGVIYVSANQADVLALDPDERRVLMVPFEPSTLHRGHDDPYWPAFYHWLNTGGYEAIAHYLLTYNLEGFSPHFYPPNNAVKEQAAAASIKPEQQFFEEFIDDPYTYVSRARKWITSHELFMLYAGEPAGPHNTNARRALMRHASAGMYLTKAISRQVVIQGIRTNVYWVCDPQPMSEDKIMQALRGNLKKYPIKL